MPHIAIVLLSGGLDSATAAAWMLRQGVTLSALTVDYGQSHAREVNAARRVAAALDIPHQVVDARFFAQVATHSALTQPDRHAAPFNRAPETMAGEIPLTYVPLRNTFLLTLAAAALESRALDSIENAGLDPGAIETSILIGANAIDYSGYPDCRPEYYRAVLETLRLGSKIGTAYGVQLQIATPLIDKSKADIVALASELGAPIEHTWSCYGGGPAPCGRCDSCILRANGFRDAGRDDPALALARAEA